MTALTNAGFDSQLITDLQLFHALLGNWDYALSTDGRDLWNTEVIELENGKLFPVPGDFDLSTWVTGEVRLSAPRDYHPELGEVERQARYDIEHIQRRVSKPSFTAGINRFVPQRAAIESQINGSQIDDPGRTNALRQVSAFFEALALTTP